MILVSGATGSGKSTLIAGLIKAKIEEPCWQLRHRGGGGTGRVPVGAG